jgi:hypothetical protein
MLPPESCSTCAMWCFQRRQGRHGARIEGVGGGRRRPITASPPALARHTARSGRCAARGRFRHVCDISRATASVETLPPGGSSSRPTARGCRPAGQVPRRSAAGQRTGMTFRRCADPR